MKKLACALLLILGMGIIGGGIFSPLYSQSYRFVDKDTVYLATNLNGQYPYTFLYFENPDSTTPYTDTIMVYNYNPIQKNWIPSKLINLSENTETTAGSPILLTDGIKKVFAFYEMYIYGVKVRRLNTVLNNNPLNMFVKNTGGR